jgi:Protein of unknown function (DUF998)
MSNTAIVATPTRTLLAVGVVAGPIYVVVGLAEAFTREGFNLTRHSLSLLANGRRGWIHSALLVTTGVLTIAGALGLRRALRGGPGRTWWPILLGLYGAGLVVAGFLIADPAQGFPPGTPRGPPTTASWHGIGHLVAGGVGFVCLIAACVVFARRFAADGERGWALYSLATGIIFFVGFAGIASGNRFPWINIGFGITVVIAWAWISAVCARTLAALQR